MALQVLPRQKQAGGQTNAHLLQRQFKGPRRPSGTRHTQQLLGTLLRQLAYGGLRPVGGRPPIAEDLVDLEISQRNGQGQHTFPAFTVSYLTSSQAQTVRMEATLSLICWATAGLFMVYRWTPSTPAAIRSAIWSMA